jgi:hypothetical protein
MKIKDLIKELEQHDPEMQVVRAGYEGGVEFVSSVKCFEVALDVNLDWWYGKHELLLHDLQREELRNYEKTQAVLVS